MDLTVIGGADGPTKIFVPSPVPWLPIILAAVAVAIIAVVIVHKKRKA